VIWRVCAVVNAEGEFMKGLTLSFNMQFCDGCKCGIFCIQKNTPHQYTLRNLLIRTPGVHVDPSGISSFMIQVNGMLSQKWFLITSAMMY